MPIPDRRIFHLKDMHPWGIWGIRPSFPGLSPCPGQVAYVLLTSAPVAARSIATSALPLDLHVLSLSLAFILSQDQTLRCCISSFLSLELNENATASCLPARLGIVLCSYYLPVFGILTWTLGSSLPCLCTVNFPHCKHFNELSFPAHETARKRRQKNRSRNLTSCEPQKRCKITTAAQTDQIFPKENPIFNLL